MISSAILIFKNPEGFLEAVSTGTTDAVTLSLKMLAIYAFWMGIIKIVENLKIDSFLKKPLKPIMNFLFGELDDETNAFIMVNISSNLLGLGNAATPSGISAIRCMAKNNKSTKASYPMIMLFVINASSIQIIPTTVISLRSSYNSVSPSSIILPTIITSVIATLIGILLVKIFVKKQKSANKTLTEQRQL